MKMTELQANFHKDLIMRGFTESTIKNYLLVAGEFEKFVSLPPTLFEEKHAIDFLYDCIINRKLKEDTVNYKNSIIKLLFVITLDKEWNNLRVPRMKRRRTLPIVLSKSEVKEFLNCIDDIRYRTIFSIIYSGGLRLSEVRNLKVSDIDSKAMKIIVRDGKGKKDRHTLLALNTLMLLREYWKIYKPKDYLFLGKDGVKPLGVRAIQLAFTKYLAKTTIQRNAHVHTLRHAFATHLLDAGTDIIYIQRLMGHASITSTTIYLHLRDYKVLKIKSPADLLDD
jgi:integrase/recombinase XerD